MTYSFSDRGRAAVLDRPAEISRSEIIPTSIKYHGKKKRECGENSKTDLQVQNVVINKNNLQDTEVSIEVILSPTATATACSSKIIDIEVDPPASLSVLTTASFSILADVIMLLSCSGCHSIQCLKLCDINAKKKGLARHLQLRCTICLYSHTFSPRSRLIYGRKTKENKNFIM